MSKEVKIFKMPLHKTKRSLQSLQRLHADLQEGNSSPVTRLTSIKNLASDSRAAFSFATRILSLVKEPRRTRDRKLFQRALKTIAQRAEARRSVGSAKLYRLLGELQESQADYHRLKWGVARVIRSRELLLAEHAIRITLGEADRGYWAYEMAKTYAERYDPREGSGLIHESRGPVKEIVEFWRSYCSE